MASLNLQEKANFTRLSRLLLDKGCEALRMAFDATRPRANLITVLNANKSVLQKLKPRVINVTQWDLLFPPSGNPPDSKTFDITLLTVLLRNICSLHSPATGWNRMPSDKDNSPGANITRIKLLRNEVYAHVSSTEIDDATFENLWQQISTALVDLNVPVKEIEDLKTSPSSPEDDMYVETLKEWYLKEEDCKKLMVEVNLRQQGNYNKEDSSLQVITKVTEENHQGKQLLFHVRTEDSENKRLNSGVSKICEKSYGRVEHQVLQELVKHNFESKIRSKVKLFHPGTREWLFKKVESWFEREDESRILFIKAGLGFGKTIFAAKVCEIFKKKDKFAACHFCEYSDSNLKDPMMMIMMQSLASHMTENFPGYKEKLVDQLQRPHKVDNLEDAFQIYLQSPLDEIEVEPRLIVIDGLDESTTEDKSEMVKLISDHFSDLPKSIKVLITSRPEISLNTLEHISSIEIHRENHKRDSDLLKYLKDKLPRLAARDAQNAETEHDVLSRIVEKCEGSFLYAFHVQRELEKRQDLDSISTKDIMLLLSRGMESIYEEYFRCLDEELKTILKRKSELCQLLEMLVAANNLLPVRFVARTLGSYNDCPKIVEIIDKVNEAVSCILLVSNEEVIVFHQTVYDWLLLKGEDIHRYSVTVADGKKRMWLICEQIYEEIKRDYIAGCELKPTKEVTHALEYGLGYLLASNMKESFHWLVDIIIVHVFLTFYPKDIYALNKFWRSALSYGKDISFQLRQRISWHLAEINSLDMKTTNPKFHYLKHVLDYSPQSCFTDDERETARMLAGLKEDVKLIQTQHSEFASSPPDINKLNIETHDEMQQLINVSAVKSQIKSPRFASGRREYPIVSRKKNFRSKI